MPRPRREELEPAPKPVPAPNAKPAHVSTIERFANRAGFSLAHALFIDIRGHRFVAIATVPGGQKRYELPAADFKTTLFDAAVAHLGKTWAEVSGCGESPTHVEVRLLDSTIHNVSREDIGV